MNQYTETLRYIKGIAEQDTYINKVTKGEDIDLGKTNIFPMLNIIINDASFPSEGVVSFSVQLLCVAIRDVNKEVVTDSFWEQSNEVDNHNETMTALMRLWQIMKRNFNNNNITASEAPALLKVTDSEKNRLDGWEMSFDIELPIEFNLCEALKEY
tara:strand:+ start:561 stop:1028 length:468 start_codon:yes stop_codon:yes gene_type:complete